MTTTTTAAERFAERIEQLQELNGLSAFSHSDEVMGHLTAMEKICQDYWHITRTEDGENSATHAMASAIWRMVRSLKSEAERHVHPLRLVDAIVAIEQEYCHIHWMRGQAADAEDNS